jgi:2-amino-4-hydroxy-6-hydroxymethyldihydropteridine diphosphokinase
MTQGPEVDAYVALGSNLGDREAHLAVAIEALRTRPGVRVTAVSRVYETAPVGPPHQGPYLNAVARLRTGLAPRELLATLLEIEAAEGRQREAGRYCARTLDLDLLCSRTGAPRDRAQRVPAAAARRRCRGASLSLHRPGGQGSRGPLHNASSTRRAVAVRGVRPR